MALGMLLTAINGAAAKVRSTEGSVWQKARLALTLTYLLAKELAGGFLLLPMASRSFFVYASLPAHAHAQAHGTQRPRHTSSSVARNIRYGSAPRNLLDVYVPPCASQEQKPAPVLMFVHGGVWASGGKNVFAHVGASLARQGVLAVVIQYTLHPEVLAREQVREVSEALSWVLDNAGGYGGDPARVTMMGHSAGAHLAAMVVWERYLAAAAGGGDARQPATFVGLAGVYDIAAHRTYEAARGVESLSSMTPAMGGLPHLPAMSPASLFLLEPPPADVAPPLPPTCALFTSRSDLIVPPATSLAFHRVLTQHLRHVGCHLTVYERLRHGDFIDFDSTRGELSSHSRHILRIIHAP